MEVHPALTPQPLVVQHNALVNARFDLTTNEARLFMALLSRVQRHDTAFSKCQVTVREVMGGTASKNSYEQMRRMLKDFGGRTLVVEQLGQDGKLQKQPSFTVLPLLAYATYVKGEGLIEAQFNDLLLPYLLQLRDNFTKAQLTELLKLKSANSYRIYWLLREYASFGKRIIRLSELKAILGLEQEYDRFNNFRARVLERAKAELAETDLPFTYEAIKEGREVVEIKFLFPPASNQAIATEVSVPAWQSALLSIGVSVKSLAAVEARLQAGEYDEGYVQFVLDAVRKQVKAGKIKKEGGAVFKALVDGYLLDDYRKAQQTPASAIVKASPVLSAKRKRLLSALEDAYTSQRFIKTAVIYTDETRPVAIADVQATIDELQRQLQALEN
ncbi:replication initiation protein [Hymenobacter sp. ASUV-10]|uniref:Replication initiation protein n=1 Tax=Hymenobacter aranciens TaxID=3063996 RepID=A0ABT9BJ71_9BACT|nr:replication initiation protein [Hymenobacter sp. ASUV-10]MDO7877718.1 replication initiation protein [Hymenobacter sp. ASUV-10]